MRPKNIEGTERFKSARTRAANMGYELGKTVNGYSVRKTGPEIPQFQRLLPTCKMRP